MSNRLIVSLVLTLCVKFVLSSENATELVCSEEAEKVKDYYCRTLTCNHPEVNTTTSIRLFCDKNIDHPLIPILREETRIRTPQQLIQFVQKRLSVKKIVNYLIDAFFGFVFQKLMQLILGGISPTQVLTSLLAP
uniref:Uncharacterized protein n=1 Tax=Tetranychus urticae TaxID=32264 RepID=T1JWC0_TETUR